MYVPMTEICCGLVSLRFEAYERIMFHREVSRISLPESRNGQLNGQPSVSEDIRLTLLGISTQDYI